MATVSVGTFPKDINHNTCQMFAQRALQLAFVDVWWDLNDPFVVIGLGSVNVHPNIVVTVNCVPQGTSTWVEVIVTGNDLGECDALRNQIRAQIVNASIFDPPPIHPLRMLSYQDPPIERKEFAGNTMHPKK